ncbi:ParB/RepB/Spo0J family partition protein [Aliarcobacter butzleri]|uniref:ParB/RepB/Spo0J family partition protein n=1 Tax=Aliarcobacter butzleri TaxID=28197 RepID=UPI00345016CA
MEEKLTNQQLLDLEPIQIMKFILDNPDQEISILERLKNNVRTKMKWIKINNDLKSAKLNPRGAGAIKVQALQEMGNEKNKEEISIIKVDLIKPNPDQPRKVWNEEKLKELSESIKEHGLLQPIAVNKNSDGTYTLIAGERRLRAHKLAGLTEIKALILETTKEESKKLALLENTQRADLSPLEEGFAYKVLQEEGNYSLRNMEDIVHKNKNYIAARINLTKFDDDCLEFIFNHELTNVTKLLKILETEKTVHKTLLEKLSKNDLSETEIEKFKIKKIEKLPDERIEDKKSSKQKDVDHDKFNDDGDFSQNKKEAQVEALSEKIRNENGNGNEDSEQLEASIIKKTAAISIIGNKSTKVRIEIDIENITGSDLAALKEFINSI